jgi:hypothetical protein
MINSMCLPDPADVQRNIDAGAADAIRTGANEHLLVDQLDAVRARCDEVARTATPVTVR